MLVLNYTKIVLNWNDIWLKWQTVSFHLMHSVPAVLFEFLVSYMYAC